MNAKELLKNGWQKKFLVCVGLDTDPKKIPQYLITDCHGDEMLAILEFNKYIVDATGDIVLAYKINIAFYEKYGAPGLIIFEKTIEFIKENYPEVFIITDAKRGDIGNTNEGYTVYLDKSDALTISGYFGQDANEPFLNERFKDKLIIVLAKTSNKGSAEIQDLVAEGLPVYLHMAKNVMNWSKYDNCAIVVGATHPSHLLQARSIIGPNGIILVPGVGAQGGDLKTVIVNGTNKDGEGIIINVSRSVIYASKGYDFAGGAREEVLKMNSEIAEYLKLPKVYWEEVRPQFYEDETFKILAEAKAILKDDHFVYQKGEHGPAYVAKDKVSPNPLAIDEIGRMLADLMKELDIDTVAVPAVGGIVLGHTVARYLSYFTGKIVNSIFLEKNTENKDASGSDKFIVTRGYEEYITDKKVAVIEDITNTGDTVINIVNCIGKNGGVVTTVGVICNRGGVKAEDIGENITLINLSVLDLEKYKPDECPLCANGIPINMTFGHGKKFISQK